MQQVLPQHLQPLTTQQPWYQQQLQQNIQNWQQPQVPISNQPTVPGYQPQWNIRPVQADLRSESEKKFDELTKEMAKMTAHVVQLEKKLDQRKTSYSSDNKLPLPCR